MEEITNIKQGGIFQDVKRPLYPEKRNLFYQLVKADKVYSAYEQGVYDIVSKVVIIHNDNENILIDNGDGGYEKVKKEDVFFHPQDMEDLRRVNESAQRKKDKKDLDAAEANDLKGRFSENLRTLNTLCIQVFFCFSPFLVCFEIGEVFALYPIGTLIGCTAGLTSLFLTSVSITSKNKQLEDYKHKTRILRADIMRLHREINK